MNRDMIDWNEVWKEQMLMQNQSQHAVDCAAIWDKKENAQLFLKMFQGKGEKLIENTLKDLPLTPESRVLDIGAGPGTLAIPLSEMVSHVTAVEPSPGMIGVLQDQITENDIGNIKCVHKRWEDVEIGSDLEGSYDVVIASYSLGMPDIKEAVRKMEAASSRYVYIYWFAGETSWDANFKALWPSLHGTNYYPAPKCDILYNVLYRMGIYPHINVIPFEHVHRFSSEEESVDHFKSYFNITEQHQDAILRDYLKDHLEEDDDGAVILRGLTTRVKMWWEKGCDSGE
ncbi:SAM-dependent methlyltransferase [Methanococcoides methylutens]|uniref:SAM-dependent methlyltransferase n=2 Tax=Methanococcoides methylutens TaxID=2226 RepID=A0A099SZL0_METMT|nr:class I SAM-dependent methyltransferase [Methanococcoides methylutens]KGK98335.1 SAM-dependent methlyltransferase [Methanococcoides methylutens]